VGLVPVVSSRRKYYNAGEVSRADRVRLVNLADPRRANNKAVSMKSFIGSIGGRRVVLVIHGYNNTFEEICDAYLRISYQLDTCGFDYDSMVGYVWPGGTKKLSYWPARKRARQVSKRLGRLIKKMSASAVQVDIVAHSLGCFLLLKALQGMGNSSVRNIYLMAAAVGNYKLTAGTPFANAANHAGTAFVLKSEDDNVLKYCFPIGERGDDALGYTGPVPVESVVRNAFTVDCSGCDDPIRHRSYSRRSEIFQFVCGHTEPACTPCEMKLC
jgi:esterase/lipase superfamily enzyme